IPHFPPCVQAEDGAQRRSTQSKVFLYRGLRLPCNLTLGVQPPRLCTVSPVVQSTRFIGGVRVDRDTISNSGGLRSGMVAVEPPMVRAQLERLFASAHLRNSRRSQDLLRFVVEAVLDGCADRIKERTIGVEVFGRELEYDTNHDSVVRNAAIEVRKRLA